jgi:hypothetical protein
LGCFEDKEATVGLLLRLVEGKSTELPLAVGSRYKCEFGEFDPRESVDKDKRLKGES